MGTIFFPFQLLGTGGQYMEKLMSFYIYSLSNHLKILVVILVAYNEILLSFLYIKIIYLQLLIYLVLSFLSKVFITH